MVVQVHYFGVLQDQAGCASERFTTQADTTYELLKELQNKGRIVVSEKILRVALNDEFCNWSKPLSDGDNVAFMPPMAGG